MYKISWLERKTTVSGKEKADVMLEQADGTVVNNVTIWGDFPGFAELAPGHTVEGTLRPASDPKYGPTLYPIKKPIVLGRPSFMGGGAGKTAAIEKAQDRTHAHVKEAQENKGHAIMVAAAMRDATLLAIAAVDGSSFETIEEREEALMHAHATMKAWYLKTWAQTEKETDLPF